MEKNTKGPLKRARKHIPQCIKDEAQALLELIPQLDENFKKVVDMMFNCKGKIIVTGVGKSGNAGARVATALSSAGTSAFYISPLDIYHGDLGVTTPDDVVLALSNNGQTNESLRFLSMVLHTNIPVVSISGNPKSLPVKYSTAHITYHVEKEICPLNLAPANSTTAALAMGDALAVVLTMVKNFKPNDSAQFHLGSELGKRLLTTASDVIRSNSLSIIPKEMYLGDTIIHVSKGKLGLGMSLENGKVVRLITDGGTRRAMEKWQAQFSNKTVSDIMIAGLKAVSPNTEVTEIQTIMHRYKIHAVPVVDDDNHLLRVVDHYSYIL